MATTLQGRSYTESLNAFLTRLDKQKSAAAKTADELGKTTHPSDKVDDNTQNATEGARASENTKDIKENIPAGGLSSATTNSGGTSDNQINVGTTKSPTGEHPEVEDDYKDRAKDTPTSHPATTAVGEKYSSWSLSAIQAEFSKVANEVLAGIFVANQPKTDDKTKQAAPTTPAVPASATTEEQAAASGYKVAEALSADKSAADALASNTAEYFIREALYDATLVGDFFAERHNRAKAKLANELTGEGTEGESNEEPAAAPPAAPLPESAMDDAGAGVPPGADGASGGNEEAALQQLLMALEELGITPQELAMLAQQQGGAAGGGVPPPPEGAGMPPTGGMPVYASAKVASDRNVLLNKIASGAKNFQRTGKYERRLPKNAAERQKINYIKEYIRELVG